PRRKGAQHRSDLEQRAIAKQIQRRRRDGGDRVDAAGSRNQAAETRSEAARRRGGAVETRSEVTRSCAAAGRSRARGAGRRESAGRCGEAVRQTLAVWRWARQRGYRLPAHIDLHVDIDRKISLGRGKQLVEQAGRDGGEHAGATLRKLRLSEVATIGRDGT